MTIFNRRSILLDWLHEDFREAVLDDDLVLQAAAMLKVAQERGDSSIEAVRRCIAAFVVEMIDPGKLDAITNKWRQN